MAITIFLDYQCCVELVNNLFSFLEYGIRFSAGFEKPNIWTNQMEDQKIRPGLNWLPVKFVIEVKAYKAVNK